MMLVREIWREAGHSENGTGIHIAGQKVVNELNRSIGRVRSDDWKERKR